MADTPETPVGWAGPVGIILGAWDAFRRSGGSTPATVETQREYELEQSRTQGAAESQWEQVGQSSEPPSGMPPSGSGSTPVGATTAPPASSAPLPATVGEPPVFQYAGDSGPESPGDAIIPGGSQLGDPVWQGHPGLDPGILIPPAPGTYPQHRGDSPFWAHPYDVPIPRGMTSTLLPSSDVFVGPALPSIIREILRRGLPQIVRRVDRRRRTQERIERERRARDRRRMQQLEELMRRRRTPTEIPIPRAPRVVRPRMPSPLDVPIPQPQRIEVPRPAPTFPTPTMEPTPVSIPAPTPPTIPAPQPTPAQTRQRQRRSATPRRQLWRFLPGFFQREGDRSPLREAIPAGSIPGTTPGLTVDEATSLSWAAPSSQQRRCKPCKKPRKKRKNPSNVVATVKPFQRRMSRNSLENLK